MRRAGEKRLSIGERSVMDETTRRDNSDESYTHSASNHGDTERRDEIPLLFRRREREPQSLTKREREERWPIG
jgi:hypothetical protein